MRHFVVGFIALSLSLGCQLPMPNRAASTVERPTIKRGAMPRPASPFADASLRVVDLTGGELVGKVKLIGKVKLLSDKGLGIISNNTSGIISNNSGGIISANGGNYRLQAAPEEALLAEATIGVMDAEGKILTTPDGEPITAKSDRNGAYTLEATLPRETMILTITLFGGGQLLALLPRDFSAEQALDIDTASSLGTGYVLDRYVKKRRDVLAKLPPDEIATLKKDMEKARALLTAIPSYDRAAMAAAVEALRGQDATLHSTLKRIEALLLAGQEDLGNGLKATETGLVYPTAVVGDGQGTLYIAEGGVGRIRKVSPNGVITQLTVPSGSLGKIADMVLAPDGSLYVTNRLNHQVSRVSMDGQVTLVAGSGLGAKRQRLTEGGVSATETPMRYPMALAVAQDGTLYLGEAAKSTASSRTFARLLTVDAEGIMREVPPLPDELMGGNPTITGLAFDTEGTLAMTVLGASGFLALRPIGGDWQVVTQALQDLWDGSRVAFAEDGTLVVADTLRHQVLRVARDGTITPIAGITGQAGYAGDGGPATAALFNQPTGLWVAPDGTIYLIDSGNALVRAIAPDGTVKTVAGARGVTQQGDALTIALNAPLGATIDPQGRIVVSEGGGCTVKRLENGQLTVVAGTSRGFSGDGAAATAAQLDTPGAIAYHGEELFIIDTDNARLRKVDAAGVISTVAGQGPLWEGLQALRRFPVASSFMRTPSGLAIAADGTPYWSDAGFNQIFRLEGEEAVVVAGALDRSGGFTGDGGAAADATLSRPLSLAFDPGGRLYVADAANMVVRRIGTDGAIETFAGTPFSEALAKVFAYDPTSDEGKTAKEALFLGPIALAFDAAGNLYVGEAGTVNIGAFAPKLPVPVELIPSIGARIRKITPGGVVTTVAGAGTELEPDLGIPVGLAFDRNGNLIVSDGGNNQIKLLPKRAL